MPRSDAGLTAAQLDAFCRRSLAGFKIPEGIRPPAGQPAADVEWQGPEVSAGRASGRKTGRLTHSAGRPGACLEGCAPQESEPHRRDLAPAMAFRDIGAMQHALFRANQCPDRLRRTATARGKKMRLVNKVAVVTGGTSGIGRKIVERFRSEGAAVVFSGRRRQLGEEVASVDRSHVHRGRRRGRGGRRADHADGRRCTWHGRYSRQQCRHRLAQRAGREYAARRLRRDHGGARPRRAGSHETGGARSCARRRSGSIINISSIAAHLVGHGSFAYSTAKAALNHLTRCAALDLGEDNVRVNSISAGRDRDRNLRQDRRDGCRRGRGHSREGQGGSRRISADSACRAARGHRQCGAVSGEREDRRSSMARISWLTEASSAGAATRR